jgi:SAM-dependent methyltransferase
MRLAKGTQENGVVVGNTYDKYGSRNPVVRYLMQGFERSLQTLVTKTGAKEIHEVGCGEGYWTLRWLKKGYQVRGSDFSVRAIELARINADSDKVDLKVASVYDLTSPNDAAELVVCCEVLEHLEDPERALGVLKTLASPFLIVSVPCEPVWRILNLIRGSYWKDLGNTPGHRQHWSKRAFVELVGAYFEILDVQSPLPWTMILAKQERTVLCR